MPFRRTLPTELRTNPEFQSAVVRICLWVFGLCYIGFGALAGIFVIRYVEFFTLFLAFLVLTIGVLISVLVRPVWEARRYFAHNADVLAVSFAIYLVGDANSPFYLIYILIFISAGTRYGRPHLAVATISAVIAYNLLLLVLEEWTRQPMNSLFRVLVLVLLPLYQDHLLRQLREAKLAAERASQAKGTFLANMTHELRTPLTGVLGMTKLLRATDLDREQREYADAIGSSANMLQALIGDILDLSKIEAGKLHLECRCFDLHRTVKEVYDILQTNALAKELEIICDIAADAPRMIHGDPLRIRQVLLNLLGNAVKFTEHGEIVIRVRRGTPDEGLARPQVRLEIDDTGIGIAADKLATIFESFSQADDSMTRRYGGTGLGTTIARDLVTLMGGTIDVSSTPGRGSSFRVRLPLDGDGDDPPPAANPVLAGRRALLHEPNPTAGRLIATICRDQGMHCSLIGHEIDRAAEMVRAAGDADLLIVGDTPAGMDLPAAVDRLQRLLDTEAACLLLTYNSRRSAVGDRDCSVLSKPFQRTELIDAMTRALDRHTPDEDAGEMRPATRNAEERPLAGMRILVAEDNAIAARVITTLLSKQGADVTLARDGNQAFAMLADPPGFDVAFVDLHMPGLDGLALTRQVREREANAKDIQPLKLIALTANAAEDVRTRCLAAGMDGFLTKPVDPAALIETARTQGRPRDS